MRRIRIGIGLVVALCAFCTAAAPSLAAPHKKAHTKPPKVLGKFVANFPHGPKITETSKAVDKGVGSVEELKFIGGKGAATWFTISPGARGTGCRKVKSSGGVDSERSDTLFESVEFMDCRAALGFEGVKEVPKISNFKIGFEFHSNGFIESGGGEATSVHVNHTAVFIKRKGGLCTIEIPAQTVPIKATKKPENEFEAATYETEKYPEKIKRFPAGFQEELDITVELSKVVSHVHKGPYCDVGAYKNDTGVMDFELEEVEIKKGDLGFRDKAEVEAEEKAHREAVEKENAEKSGSKNPEQEQLEREEAERAETEKVENEEKAEKEKAEKVEQEEKEKQEKEQQKIEEEEG
jgi:hypothetical protein